MMYPRLKLARNLLSDDGVLIVSIDDNESANLRKLGDEVFGAQNFVAQLAVQINPRGRHLDRFVAKTHDSIMIFVRNIASNAIAGIAKDNEMTKDYNRSDARGPFRLLGLRNRNQAFNPQTRPNLYYPLYVCPENGEVSTAKGERFRVEIYPNAPDGTPTCWTWSRERVISNGDILLAEKTGNEWRIYRKDHLHGEDGEIAKTLVKSIWLDKEFSNDYGRKAVKDLFGQAVMDFPKSPHLMRRLVEIGCGPNDIVLDFFAGSCSMAHAVMLANAADSGRRRFIMIQLDEEADPKSDAANAGFPTISALSRERIRRAGSHISTDAGLTGAELDLGFRATRIDTTNMIDVLRLPDDLEQNELELFTGSVKPDRSGEDLLFQVLLDWGLELTMSISVEQIDGHEIFDVDNGALIACFESELAPSLIRKIAEREPLRAVFRDSGFGSDAERINAEQIFAEISPSSDIKVI